MKHALNNELDIFVNSLLAMLKAIQKQLDSDEVDVQMCQPVEMSPLVQRVQWAKLMEAKVFSSFLYNLFGKQEYNSSDGNQLP